jgi:hypothetical protein
MSEAAIATPEIAVTPEDVAALTPDQRANASEAFRKAGYSEEQVRKAFSVPTDTPPSGTTISGVGYDGLSDAERVQGYNTLLKFATTNEQRRDILEAATRQGVTLKDQNGQVLRPDGSPGEHSYQFSYANLDRDTMGQMAEDFATYDAGMKNGFGALQVPPDLAQRLFDAFTKSAEVYRDFDDPELMAAEVTKNATTLRGLQGGAEIARLAKVGEEYILAKSPGFHEWTSTNFCLHSAQSQVILSQLGQWVERQTRGKKS